MMRWRMAAGDSLPPPRVRAWYTYAFAAEVFSACALAIFLPITLEHMARDVGFIAPDLIVPCNELQEDVAGSAVCRARILGVWVDTASFSMYVKSTAVALQALFIISVGPLADSGYWRKRLLGAFALCGSISGTLFFLMPSIPISISPIFAAALTVCGNICYAVGIVCSNAFLPVLAKEDEAVKTALAIQSENGDEIEGLEGSRFLPAAAEPVVTAISPTDLARADPDNLAPNTHAAILSLATSRISSMGTAVGFFSGVAVLALLLIPVRLGGGSTASLCTAIGISGIWWGVFLIPAWLGLPGGDRDASMDDGWLVRAWKRVGRMVTGSQMRRIPNLFILLLAWIFLSDGFHTTTYTAILYASSTLHMPPSKVILIGILVQLAAVFSSILAPPLQHRLGQSNLQFLLCIVLLAEVIPVYACLGLVLPWGGLRTEGEMYAAATWFGMLYGPFNSYSRAVYAELIPPGHESSFFSLFSLTDKSASFLGPLVVGIIADATGNIRLGFVFLLIMLALPVPVLLWVNMDDGRRQARQWGGTMILGTDGEGQRLLDR